MAGTVRITVHVRGPITDGRARRAAADFTDELRHEVALEGGIMWVEGLMGAIKHPTPYYWTKIDVDDLGSYDLVHDNRIVYGPWLEGTGSRNYPVTRFRGYHQAKRTTRVLARRVPTIARKLLRQYIRRMGG